MLECLLSILVCFVVARTRDLEGEVNLLEIVPSVLQMNLSSSLLPYPERDFLACPESAIRSRLLRHLPEVALQFLIKQGHCACVLMPLISEDRWPILIVAAGQYPNPVGTVTCDRHDLAYSFPLRKKPNNLEMAAFNRIDGFSIAACQLIDTEVVSDGHILWHWRNSSLKNSSRGSSF